MCRKTQPHTRTLGNFPEHLTYQVVSGIRLCNRDAYKRTAGSVGFAVLSEATPTSTLTPSKRSMSSKDYWSTSSCVCFNCSCIRVRHLTQTKLYQEALRRCPRACFGTVIHVAKSGPAWSEHGYMFSVVWIADGLPTRHEELQ